MEDRCVCCGALIPEGQMVCNDCLTKQNEKKVDKSVNVDSNKKPTKHNAVVFK